MWALEKVIFFGQNHYYWKEKNIEIFKKKNSEVHKNPVFFAVSMK